MRNILNSGWTFAFLMVAMCLVLLLIGLRRFL